MGKRTAQRVCTLLVSKVDDVAILDRNNLVFERHNLIEHFSNAAKKRIAMMS